MQIEATAKRDEVIFFSLPRIFRNSTIFGYKMIRLSIYTMPNIDRYTLNFLVYIYTYAKGLIAFNRDFYETNNRSTNCGRISQKLIRELMGGGVVAREVAGLQPKYKASATLF
jgi:hypothetical protein